jgi:Ca-activated chloride channel family protein
MNRRILSRSLSLCAVSISVTLFVLSRPDIPKTTAKSNETQGSLQVLDSSGKPKGTCPLKHTDVKAEISGFVSRVVVTQQFENPFKEKIEAVYTFPLPQNAAVDDMTMLVGERTVRGKILRREEAQAVYEAAKSNGQVASLLDQERPNIFTQSVANIMPGEQVKITISYVEKLKYEDGTYEFVFPMVVGPRYVPGEATGAKVNGFAPDTDRVPDASRITPSPVPEGMRAGHDISIDVSLDAGVAIDGLKSGSQEIFVEQTDNHSAHVRLKNESVIPNKDFVLRYDVAGKNISDALLTHRSEKGGFFTLILQPPERVTAEDVTPKELVFVLDTSGSMSGFPIEKAKETMKLALDALYPGDTFNLITFAGDTRILFPEPVLATPENLKKAQSFLASSTGSGGTEMMKAITAALEPSDKQDHVRIVCFMTDGYVGNDMEIISEVQKHPNARVFAFGIGGSVNRFLLDKMAESGRGEVEYVALNDDGSAAARRFHERIRNPLLTDISIDFNGLPVADIYPRQIPDLFGAKPLILTGRYTAAGNGTVKLKGKMGGREFVRELPVDFPATQKEHDVLPSLWARSRIDDLMAQDYAGAQRGAMRPELQQTITNLGLEYRLLTQFTSFVAVEEMIVTDGGQPRRVDVPVELPEGVNGSAVDKDQPGASPYVASFGRSASGLYSMSPGTVSQTVMVTSSADAVDTTRPGGTTVLNQSIIDPGSLTSARSSKSKPKTARSSGGAGGGGGAGVGSGAGMASAPIAVDGLDVTGVRLTPEQLKQRELQTKLAPAILQVVARLKNKQVVGNEQVKFVHDGKAEVQIWLTDKSDAVMAELKQLGFEVVLDPKTAKLVIGRLPIENLEKLAALKSVRYVAPQLN